MLAWAELVIEQEEKDIHARKVKDHFYQNHHAPMRKKQLWSHKYRIEPDTYEKLAPRDMKRDILNKKIMGLNL